MSLFNNDSTPAQKAAQQIVQLASMQFQQLQRAAVQGFNLIWNNRQASPQEVIAALGTNAQAVFELAQLNIETVINAASVANTTAPTLPSIPSNYTLTFNSDGSATVTMSSSSSSSSSS